jgi:hypothetical protein
MIDADAQRRTRPFRTDVDRVVEQATVAEQGDAEEVKPQRAEERIR